MVIEQFCASDYLDRKARQGPGAAVKIKAANAAALILHDCSIPNLSAKVRMLPHALSPRVDALGKVAEIHVDEVPGIH